MVPRPPLEIYAAGEHNQVPLLVGSMANEGHLLFPLNEALTPDALEQWLRKRFGDETSELLRLYSADLDQSAGRAQREIVTDQFMAWGMRNWARQNAGSGQPSYLYFFSHVPPAFRLYLPHATDLQLPAGPRSGGAYHSGDLAYVFGTLGLVGMDWNLRDRELARQITGYWTNFAKTGDPNGKGLPHWQVVDSALAARSGDTVAPANTMVFGASSSAQPGVRTAKLDLFDRVQRTGN